MVSKKYITRIFLVEDDAMYSKIIKMSLEENDGYDVHIFSSGEEMLGHVYLDPDIVIIDYNLPGMSGLDILHKIKHIDHNISTIFLSGQDKLEIVVKAYNSGANNYIIKNDNVIFELKHCLENLRLNANLRKEVQELREQIIDRNKYQSVIGESKPILNVLKLIQKIENTNLITLITGESGTGKEVVSKAIHYNSPRKRNPFIAVNVGAIPTDLIESELFGHEKGAFTGAVSKRIGKFEESHGGTIFLDEIGEMAMDLQTKLLRVLQDSKITRLGSNKEINIDMRVIAATNKNLTERVKEGKFREDLFYRLQGFLIHLPPLRDRRDDVLVLAKHFLETFCKNHNMPVKSISAQVSEELLNYPWPGNVRELKSTIERAALLSDSTKIQVDDLVFSTTVV